jgi:Zn finger protein HypA/HybF involved in hydrogenase expression
MSYDEYMLNLLLKPTYAKFQKVYFPAIRKVLITVLEECLIVMQEIQKAKCSSCGTTFMAQNGATLCPSCSTQQDHQHGGCGCGH